MLNLPDYRSTNYPLAVKEQMNKLIKEEYTDEVKKILKLSQFVGKEFYVKSGTRGLLVCLGTGQGKTRFLSAVVNDIHAADPTRKIIVLSAKSLEANAVRNIAEYTKQSEDEVKAKYTFISLNASNMFKQISTFDKDRDELEFENRLGSFMDDVSRKNSLENALLIVDEAHNLFNSITNGAKNAMALYDLIMQAKDLRLLFLTGTPIINDPVELIACFNMCRGYMHAVNKVSNVNKVHKVHNADRTDDENLTLFSEYMDEFEEYFIDREHSAIKNRDKFMNRIFGLTSYYGDLYFAENMKEGFPKELPMIIEKIPMSDTQFARYSLARAKELDESKQTFRRKIKSRFATASGSSMTSYRVQSRQISNYCIPEYALGPARGKKAREKFIGRITDQDLANTAEWSPKFARMIHNIELFRDSPGLVYSQFVSGEGIELFARVLEARGYTSFKPQMGGLEAGAQYNDSALYGNSALYGANAQYNASAFDEYGIQTNFNFKHKNESKRGGTDAKPLRYAILSGNVLPEDRVKIINAFNRKENADGSVIHLILISSAGAEGLDLKRIRHVHIMECFWNFARINQVKARAIRYLSHVDLPVEQQTVQVYIYLSDYPTDYPKKKIKEPTTDIDMYNKSINNMRVINAFMLALAESSFDCSIHYPHLDPQIKEKINCKMCSPNDQELFNPDIDRDITLPNNCKEFKEKQITANEIVYIPTGEKFYYKIGPGGPLVDLSVYMFNKKLQGFAPMPRSYPHYGAIIEMIIEANLNGQNKNATDDLRGVSDDNDNASDDDNPSDNSNDNASASNLNDKKGGTESQFPRWIIKQNPDYKYFITTEGSIHYSLMPFHKKQVSDFIRKYYQEVRNNSPNVILDASAHIGVDTINLAEMYPDAKITSCELNPNTYKILKKNIETFCKVKNWKESRFNVINDNIINVLLPNKTTSNVDSADSVDIIFFDPPWGGKDYKKFSKMSLYYMSEDGADYNVGDLIDEYLKRNLNAVIMIRLPYNYKFSDIKNKIIASEMILTNNRDAYYMCCVVSGA